MVCSVTEDVNLYEALETFTLGESSAQELRATPEAAARTLVDNVVIQQRKIMRFTNEFWTSRQRQASPIHEISYRGCYKPQLPRFFISLFTRIGETVYDPFSGRGTTGIEAGIMGRKIIVNDINPLSTILAQARFAIPDIKDVQKRLENITFEQNLRAELDLSMFYNTQTESEIVSLRNYFRDRRDEEEEDYIDLWIRMVATNRLTGHSPGFFSVYTLPPNQAVSPERQKRINEQRKQVPPYRDVKKLILRKTKTLLNRLPDQEKNALIESGKSATFLTKDARVTKEIPNESVQLTVTSPPFLDNVQYSQDNWLRCWFNTIDVDRVAQGITIARNVGKWSEVMGDVFQELFRITHPEGWVAFEVGEIRKGEIKLEEYVVPLGINAGFECKGIVINAQTFTKTANIWGISNNKKGTNSNRVVLFQKLN